MAMCQQILNQDQEKCYALAISGGGVKAAYQLGVVYSFAHEGAPGEYEYDVVSGVSAGSINNGIFSLFPKGQEKQMTEFGQDLVKNMDTSVIFKEWPGGIVDGLEN